jgi:hypothetical protein
VRHQLVSVALEASRVAVDEDRRHLEAVEVEVELAERAGGRDLRGQGGFGLQGVGRRVDLEVEVVVLDVVAAVAQRREVGITDAGGAGLRGGGS